MSKLWTQWVCGSSRVGFDLCAGLYSVWARHTVNESDGYHGVPARTVNLIVPSTPERSMARPKQTVATKDPRWMKKLKASRDHTRRLADGDTDSGSLKEDNISKETSKSLQENEGELSEDLCANTILSNPDDVGDVVLDSLEVEKPDELFSPDLNGLTKGSSVRCLDDGRVESALVSRDVDCTGCKMGSKSGGYYCTAGCGKTDLSAWEVMEHPHLGVGICRDCWGFLFSSPFTKGADGSEEQCRWCGQGGNIVLCDKCDKVFCQKCIMLNYGPVDLSQILNSNWSCFFCNPQPLCGLVKEFIEFKKAVTSNHIPVKRRATSVRGKPLSRGVRNVLDDSELTIADLLAQEEERRKKQNPDWAATRNVRPRKRKAPLNLKQIGEKGSLATETRQRKDTLTQVPSAPQSSQSKVYIRPHQVIEMRQVAAERRKRAHEEAEIERRKCISSPVFNGPKEDNANTLAIPKQNLLPLKSEFPSEVVGDGSEMKKTIIFLENKNGTSAPHAYMFGNIPRNLFANFSQVYT
uniref:PHD-type domain-containing protein n=3 Tax=Physcomitrium patens TaxID=3218 RepID=A0A7I4EMX7_PHYPA